MALRLVQIDEATGKFVRGPLVSPAGHVDESFDVTTSETIFSVTENFSATQKIDVLVEGVLKREGATHDYERNDSLSRIVFNSGVTNSWVLIRVYQE